LRPSIPQLGPKDLTIRRSFQRGRELKPKTNLAHFKGYGTFVVFLFLCFCAKMIFIVQRFNQSINQSIKKEILLDCVRNVAREE